MCVVADDVGCSEGGAGMGVEIHSVGMGVKILRVGTGFKIRLVGLTVEIHCVVAGKDAVSCEVVFGGGEKI